MKTTVKTATGRAVAQPLQLSSEILLSLHTGEQFAHVTLTPDQAGALIFGIEKALEAVDLRHRQALANIRAAA